MDYSLNKPVLIEAQCLGHPIVHPFRNSFEFDLLSCGVSIGRCLLHSRSICMVDEVLMNEVTYKGVFDNANATLTVDQTPVCKIIRRGLLRRIYDISSGDSNWRLVNDSLFRRRLTLTNDEGNVIGQVEPDRFGRRRIFSFDSQLAHELRAVCIWLGLSSLLR